MAIRLFRTSSADGTVAAVVGAPAAGAGATSSFALIGSLVIALGGLVGAVVLTRFVTPVPFVAADGFSALALFYIAAQAIERLLEPFTKLIRKAPEGETPVAKGTALANVRNAIGAGYSKTNPTEQETEAARAANWQAVVDSLRKDTALWAWAVSTALGALAAAWLGLYLMRAVGALGVPIALDVVVTGLILGGGSKALHDLIKNIEKAKEKKEDPKEKV